MGVAAAARRGGRGWRRLHEHQNDLLPGFTSRYGVKTLVWYEEFPLVVDAIAREKAIKRWPRKWKIDLIETMNPAWRDLAGDFAF